MNECLRCMTTTVSLLLSPGLDLLSSQTIIQASTCHLGGSIIFHHAGALGQRSVLKCFRDMHGELLPALC